ncbi:hypothetical protein J41TS8_04010 [Bacillus sp. J41TS8]|nr:hypothetical protein J41TS8_04010 [Bacillus sp. J41TS8]
MTDSMSVSINGVEANYIYVKLIDRLTSVGSSNLSWDVSGKSLKLLGIQGFEAFLFDGNFCSIFGLKICFGSGFKTPLFIGYPIKIYTPFFYL